MIFEMIGRDAMPLVCMLALLSPWIRLVGSVQSAIFSYNFMSSTFFCYSVVGVSAEQFSTSQLASIIK
jgi:uncharacterized protein (DUF927 family)